MWDSFILAAGSRYKARLFVAYLVAWALTVCALCFGRNL